MQQSPKPAHRCRLRPRRAYPLARRVHSTAPARAEPPQFDKDVAPILRDHCIKCHGGEARKGGLDLRTVASMTHGGDTGAAIVPGKSGESLMIEQVVSKTMPPGKNPKLTDAQVAVLRAWIDAGARADTTASSTASTAVASFWAFRPPTRPRIPSVRNRSSSNATRSTASCSPGSKQAA